MDKMTRKCSSGSERQVGYSVILGKSFLQRPWFLICKMKGLGWMVCYTSENLHNPGDLPSVLPVP